MKEYSKEWREKNPEYTKKYNKKYYEKNKEKCIVLTKKWQEENKSKIKDYRTKNKAKLKEYYKKWYKRNKKKRIEYNNKYMKERRKIDPSYRLRLNFSKEIRYALKKRGSSKNGYSWEKIVNYTTKDLMVHLEQQFTEGMTWDNYGKWHVDHIIPQSSFNFTSYEDQAFQDCWDLNNLQPLWSQDNIKKSNRIKI